MTGNHIVRRQVTVLCLTYGEPSENRFYPQFAYSLSILNRLTRRVAPIPNAMMPLIAARRARERVKRFNELGWNSRLEEYSRQQVDELQKLLSRQHPEIDWSVQLVLEFRKPYIWEFLKPMCAAPPNEIVILPLYVADSDFTSGVSRTDLENFHRRRLRFSGNNPLPVPRYIRGFGFDERSGKSLADFILKQCQEAGWGEEKLRKSVLILGAHGTVIRPPFGINSGAKETRILFGLVRRHLKPLFRSVRIGWLNHQVGGPWTFPEVAESAKESYDAGIRNVVYFTFGFIADNGETELEGKMQLAPFEWDDVLYLHCQNADPDFMELLADRVAGALDSQPGDTWETIGQGDPALERQEKPPKHGQPGFGRLKSPEMTLLAVACWMAMTITFIVAAACKMPEEKSPQFMVLCGLIATAVGGWMGWDMFLGLGSRNVLRLRRLPQPSPVSLLFSRFGWWVLGVMIGICALLTVLPLGAFCWVMLAALAIASFSCAVGHVKKSPARRRAQPTA